MKSEMGNLFGDEEWEGGSCSVLPLLTERFTKPSRKVATTAAYEWIRKTLAKAPKDLKEEIGKNFLAHFPPGEKIN